MNLHEFQSKEIFARHGVPVPKGEVAVTPAEAAAIAERLGGRAVIKAQVLTGGRGKAGGVKLANSPEEAEQLAGAILGMDIKGHTVRKVLVDPVADIATEIYLGFTNDRSARMPLLMASAAGGVDIEEVARTTPEKIIKIHVNPHLGLHDYQAREVAAAIELPPELWTSFAQIAVSLWKAYWENDATLAEINPLIVTGDGKLLGIDGKMSIDDNAMYRHPELEALRDQSEEIAEENEARKYGLSYIKLDGDIGCMVNGAGLAMTTMDIIKLFGGEPANFLDIGGGAGADKVTAAFRIILSDENVRAILINIFGGITRCDEVARGILAAMAQVELKVPLVVRFGGTNAEEGRQLLQGSRLITAETLSDAAQKAIEAAGKAVTA
ncbi:MAG TPA: ADP-forming succinate--CoA ligase subunit beta [Anaerolineales bacterium]|nr:ADP-forming succinate--CoA ligase subunit beta [Anaerolineales bacterium]